MQIEHIAPGAFIAIGDTYDANSTVLIHGDEALLVDGMASVADAEQLRWRLDEIGKRVRFIVATHYFSDHIAALRLFPEATIIAHEFYGHTYQSERHRTAEEAAHFVEPSITIGDRMRLKWGRFTLELFHNPGHTMSTLGIDVPEEDLLFAGDTTVGNIVHLPAADLPMLGTALERLDRRRRSRVIAGHGGLRNGAVVGNARHYLSRVVQLAPQRPELEACLAPGITGTEFERYWHNRNLEALTARA